MKLRNFLAGLLFLIVGLLYFAIVHYDAVHPAPAFYDLMLHTLGGIWLAGMTLIALKRLNENVLERNFWLGLVVIIALVTLIGVCWEFFEYEVNIYTHAQQNPLDDTLSDILMDMVGGALFCLALTVLRGRRGGGN